jgi:hypothetical protein
MKLRLLILLAAALAAAPAAGQTVKSLGYNTTNGQVVYSGTNTLRMPDQVKFGTNSAGIASGSQYLTLLDGGGGVALQLGTNRIIAYDEIDFGGISGTALSNAAATRTNFGLGGTNTVTFSNLQLNSFSSGGSGGFVGRNGTQLALYGTNVSSSVPAFYGWDGFNNAAMSAGTSRTNLGLGATWLTNTDVTNFRTAIGLGATNDVTFSNITASGTLAVTGNVTMSGTDNLAPSQTTNSASSLMTRSLSDTRYGEWISQTEMGQLEFTTATVATATLGGSAQVGSTNILSGSYLRLYGFTNTGDYNVVNVLAQSLLWLNSGLTPQLGDGIGLYVRAAIGVGTNRVARIVYAGVSSNQVAGIVGTNGIDRRGFALEIAPTAGGVSNNIRLIAQDGTNGNVASAWVTVASSGLANSFFMAHSNNATRVYYGTDNARPSRTPVITLNHVFAAGTQAAQPTGILFSVVNTNNDTVSGSLFIRGAWQMLNADLVGY